MFSQQELMKMNALPKKVKTNAFPTNKIANECFCNKNPTKILPNLPKYSLLPPQNYQFVSSRRLPWPTTQKRPLKLSRRSVILRLLLTASYTFKPIKQIKRVVVNCVNCVTFYENALHSKKQHTNADLFYHAKIC